jgi:hypothetical protein
MFIDHLFLIYGFMISCCMPDGTDMPASSLGTNHPAEEIIVGWKKRTEQGWYGSLFEDKKEEYRKKQRQDRLQKKSEAHVLNMDVPQSSTIDHVSLMTQIGQCSPHDLA